MNRKDIVRMAHEAGVRLASASDTVDRRNVYAHELERFFELIVRECIPFVGDPTSEAVKKMMKHFGVNER